MKVSEIMSKYLHNINKQRQNSLVHFLHVCQPVLFRLAAIVDF